MYNFDEIKTLIVSMYNSGAKINKIEAVLRTRGYKTITGRDFSSGFVSRIAHGAGCPKRYKRRLLAPNNTSVGSNKKDLILQIMDTTLDKDTKAKLIAALL